MKGWAAGLPTICKLWALAHVLYAFDPARAALLLLGGDKTGNERWCAEYVPRAERIFADHLKEIEQEGQT